MIGRTISHYQITEKLGEGGMGVVYKARDSHLKRFVALKVLPPEKVTDPERKQRFVQEARSASALNHPNIVTVYDIDQTDGVDFIAMEYVEGKTLGALIGRKGLKLSEALKYAVQIADALAKAHAAGIVHRDLKPGNVMVTAEGRVKVLDFGLAKLTETVSVGAEDLFDRAAVHGIGPDRWYGRLHVTGAGRRKEGGRPERYLQLRVGALRDADRAAGVPAGQPRPDACGDPTPGAASVPSRDAAGTEKGCRSLPAQRSGAQVSAY